MRMWRQGLVIAAVAGAAPAGAAPDDAPFAVTIDVDAGRDEGPVVQEWRFFGADEPNYATMKDGRTTLATLGALAPDRVYFRAHNLLTSGDGTPALKWGSTGVYREDTQGRPIYTWTIVDRIFDTYRARGVKPYVELGFMPEALSTRPQPYQHDWRPGSGELRTGWAYPPRDYARWEELIHQWVRHCVERYGRSEVASWYFETWNEANLPQYYWGGTREEFFRLHDAAVRGVRRALPEARVGGPDSAGAGDDFLAAFMAHARAAGTPTDFLSFHAKGQPKVVEGAGGSHVRMGLNTHLKAADHEFAAIAADPVFRTKPIVIGESDPEGCAACQGPANAYRNGTMYSSYTAASFPRLRALARRRGLTLEGVLTWAFEFEDQAPFAGFRQLNSGGIDLPVINTFKLFAKMSGRYVSARSDHQVSLDSALSDGVRGDADVGTVATRDGTRVAVLVWHYHDDDIAGPAATVRLRLRDLPRAYGGGATLTQYRVDESRANSFAAWQKMGSPLAPSDAQRTALKQAAALDAIAPAERVVVRRGAGEIAFTLPRQGVSLLVLTPARASDDAR
ncbi:GH39 family glycosyl hydrolase [Sphingomonas sp. BK345]|uniref:GH39 family glycosyl hydrolase n=1 Tax=Sphingomonas sp. BK345 TaxID=2586980 RepID=UPI00183A6F80|nr:beta-xylosidase [Sphingomonas sp. BK345]MBB3474733.1 xylan 1,4-beta-xylosidase [Sphingomonas sp. BK345]